MSKAKSFKSHKDFAKCEKEYHNVDMGKDYLTEKADGRNSEVHCVEQTLEQHNQTFE